MPKLVTQNTQGLEEPSLVVKADFSDLLWDDAAGPFENLFTWGNRFFIVFSGGIFSLLFIVLTALGMDLGSLGRMIDKMFDLRTIDDIGKIHPQEAGEQIAEALWAKLSSEETTASTAVPPLHKQADEDLAERRLRLQEQRFEQQKKRMQEQAKEREYRRQERSDLLKSREEAAERAQHERERERLFRREQDEARRRERTKDQNMRAREVEKRERAEARRYKDRLRRERARMKLDKMRLKGGASFRGPAGKAALTGGVVGALAWIMRSVTDPKSWTARALRGAGVLGAESIGKLEHQMKETARSKSVSQSKAPKSTNYKLLLERAIDNILQ